MPIPTDLKRRHRETLALIFNPPKRKAPGITYQEMLSFLVAIGGAIDEAREGSRVSATLPTGSTFVFHRPHKGRPIDGGTTAKIRKWLAANGFQP